MKRTDRVGLWRRLRVHSQAGIAVMVSWLLLPPLGVSAGGVVTIPTEAALRAAMSGGGLVTFACDGIINVSNTITNDLDTTLDAGARQITISGNNAVRIFIVRTNVHFALRHVTLANGKSDNGAAILNAGGALNLLDVCFRTHAAIAEQARGGAIVNAGGTVNATQCSFLSNVALLVYPISINAALGGAIFNESGVVNLQRCEFRGNQATAGQDFGAERKDAFGGAIYSSGTLTADACTFRENSAGGGDGDNGPYPIAPGTVYSGGSGGLGVGGAICNLGTLFVTASTFTHNSAHGGMGGVGGPAHWDSVEDGGAGGAGGDGTGSALYNDGSCVFVNCTISSNLCTGGAGGVGGPPGYNPDPHFPSGDPGSPGNGGSGLGVFNGPGELGLTNCTVALNSASAGSGGSPNGSPGTAIGGILSLAAHLLNTLLVTNTPGGNCGGVIADAGHNLSTDASCNCTNIGSLNNTDPKLGPLQDNSGPTLTIALLPGSPAINTGNTTLAPATDQRGLPRPSGADVDIGAYEYVPRLQIARAPQSGRTIRLLDGAPSQWCRLLTSTNLSDWQAVGTNQIGADGTAILQDNSGAEDSPRFYRGAMP